jgi:hypothetical protein
MTPAEAYVVMFKWAIKLSRDPASMRSWWLRERPNREKYGLSQEQIDDLTAACKEQVAIVTEGKFEEKDPPGKQRKKKHRGMAI